MDATRVRLQAEQTLAAAGLTGSFFVRDLDRDISVGIHEDAELPIASVVKLPLAAAVLDAVQEGALDPTRPVALEPSCRTPGPTGTSRFRHPATIALEDLLYLAMAVSDDTAADALFALVPPEQVTRWLTDAGVSGLRVRHRIGEIYDSIAERTDSRDLAVLHRLVVAAERSDAPSPIPQLDPASANAGSARALADLLARIWQDTDAPSRRPRERSLRLRELMEANLLRHRLAPDFLSDRARWFSKTGSFLNLRHEVGVVEHESGRRIAIAALTRSSVSAAAQPAAEAAIGRCARILHDYVLDSP